jgi:hypothetical protein
MRCRGARRAGQDQAARAEPCADHCRGAIVGVYDAEDAPDPDQLRKVVPAFQRRARGGLPARRLDYYNPRTNWLSAASPSNMPAGSALILPGIARLGLVVPLGGTTLFFRRDVLESLGGWDAHNVTEDADLGMRLARHGYRTELIDTTTDEEANCRALPWIKQRSRWIKGYMMTWAVHMRDPGFVARAGAARFLGFQVLFRGTIAQFLLAPVLWSFWLLPSACRIRSPQSCRRRLQASGPGLRFFAVRSATIAIGIDQACAAPGIGSARSGCRRSSSIIRWPPLAAYKAAWELATRPFYWDKTTHGIFDQGSGRPALSGRNSPASTRSRVSKAWLICDFSA